MSNKYFPISLAALLLRGFALKYFSFGLIPFFLAGCRPVSTPLPPLRSEIVQENAGFVVTLDFTPNGRLFYATQGGEVFVKTISQNLAESPPPRPFLSLEVSRATSQESGLLGLALSPTFDEDHYIYLYYTASDENNAPLNARLVRYTEQDNHPTNETVIAELPARPDQQYHFGGGLAFGPDGKLYLVFGDTNLPEQARDPQTPHGSILRFNPDGSIPDDNPFPGSPVYTYGHRNGFGLAWSPTTGLLYETENGTDCDDELNLIDPGKDYGWGLHPYDNCPYPDDATQPLYQWNPIAAPAGLTFYTGDRIPEWQGDLLVCGFNRRELYRFTLSRDGRTVENVEIVQIMDMDAICQAAITEGPDGWVYVTGNSRIYRIGR